MVSADAHHTFPVMAPDHHLFANQPPGTPAESSGHISVQQGPTISSAFISLTHSDEDWTKVSDFAERRRIQNRVAQRNYRKKLEESRVGFEGGFYAPKPEDRLIDEMFLQLMQKRGWHNLPETAQRQMLAYPSAKKWTLVYQDKLTEWQREQKRRTIANPGRYQPLDVAASAADQESSKRYVGTVTNSSLDTNRLGSLEVMEEEGKMETKTKKAKEAEQTSGEVQPESCGNSLAPTNLSMVPHVMDSRAQSTEPKSALSTAPSASASQRKVFSPLDTSLELYNGFFDTPFKAQKHPAFECSLCPKAFTRAYDLRSHLRTHTDGKPFACTVCGKAFARQDDRKRHEGVHSREKDFVCKGKLKDGSQWGCGRGFTRPVDLRRHFLSEAGKICIKPLLDEEGLTIPPEDFDMVYYRLPAALLGQYLDLGNIDRVAGYIAGEDTDDSSRFDSSDYQGGDAPAGNESGAETSFGDTNSWPQISSSRNRGAVDDSQISWSDPQKRADGRFPSAGARFLSYPPQDHPSWTDTGTSNLGGEPQGEVSLPLELNQDHSPLRPRQSSRGTVDISEVSFQENTHRDHSDGNMSLRSFTESVFDITSVVSSASSLHSNGHAMVSSFVDMLVRDPSMDSLLAITMSELGVSSGRFTRNFSRILKSYSRHLRAAAERSSKEVREKHLIVAKTVRNARHQVSNLIASRYNEIASTVQEFKHREVDLISRHLNQTVREDNDDPYSDEESCEDDSGFMIGDLEQFLLSGEPFRLLKRNLRSLVIPDEFLRCIYESARGFLDLILTDKSPRSFARGLLQAITNGRDITSDLNMQVRIMAADLRAECTDISQLDASIFLETYSQYISVIAIEQVKDVFKRPSQSVQDPMECIPEAALPQEDMLEKIVADTLPSVIYVDLVQHRTFLASSSTFACFIDALFGLVYPTFFSEATRSVKATIRSAETSEDSLLAMEGHRLLPILSEMQSFLQPKDTSIFFSVDVSETRATALNQAKIAIEASTASEWDWWPLQPPRHSGGFGRAELSWKCSCGTERHESTLPYYANELKRIFDNFPLFPGDSNGHIDRPPSSLSNNSSQGNVSTQSLDSSSINYSGAQRASSSSSTVISGITPPDSVVDFGTGPRRFIYVFLLIKASEYTLDTIDVSSMKARDFFQTLRAAYIKHRGLWRRAFSVFVYNHCDFIKIIKPEPETFMPGELKFELPADHDDEYHYRPRPTYSAPITKHMFKHYFYGCYDSSTFIHRIHACMPLVPTCRIRNPAAELLEFVPKRDRPAAAAAQSDKVEVCYGLVARERRSFFRVVLYLCLIMAPAFWFVFAWLFVWGDSGDLQDATVPMTLTLAVLSIFWALLYSGSDIRKEYGDGLD